VIQVGKDEQYKHVCVKGFQLLKQFPNIPTYKKTEIVFSLSCHILPLPKMFFQFHNCFVFNIECFFKFHLLVGVQKSIVNAPLV
jgi:hypothetical protein